MTCKEVTSLERFAPNGVRSAPDVPGVLFLFNNAGDLSWSLPAGDIRAQIECIREHGCTVEAWQAFSQVGQMSFAEFSFELCPDLSSARALNQLAIDRCKPTEQRK
jgi:hypothetical protein